MEPEPTVLDSLRKAVDSMPDDVPLRLHLATILLRGGQHDEAIRQLGAVLQRDPGNVQALGLLRVPLLGSGPAPESAQTAGQPPPAPAGPGDISAERSVVPPPPPGPAHPDQAREPGKAGQYDWSQAEDELRDVLPAMFIGEGEADSASAGIDEAD